MSPAIAHNEFNCSDDACGNHFVSEEGEGSNFSLGGRVCENDKGELVPY